MTNPNKMHTLIKPTSILAVLGMCTLLNMQSIAAVNSEEAIANRIKPFATVCLEGQECANTVAATPASASGARTGEDVYNASCHTCHASGLLNAPKFGTTDWQERAAKGMETLMNHALNGFNAMPAKGTCATCSDDEIKNAVQYMIDSASK